jgi:hypothetical protein
MHDARKPSNWWAFEREPWMCVGAEIRAAENAGTDRDRRTARSGAHSPLPSPRWAGEKWQ